MIDSISLEERVALMDVLKNRPLDGDSYDFVEELRYVRPKITRQEVLDLLDEAVEHSKADKLHHEKELRRIEREEEFFAQCPGWHDGLMNVEEVYRWIAEHGDDEDDRSTAQRVVDHLDNRNSHDYVDEAVDWSPWTEWCEDEPHVWRFLPGHPYGDDQDELAHVRLAMDYCVRTLHADMKEDERSVEEGGKGTGLWVTDDPRWEAAWDFWRQTVPLHIQQRIENAPDEKQADRWKEYANETGWWPDKKLLGELALRATLEKGWKDGTITTDEQASRLHRANPQEERSIARLR